jgi:hypothetical protein
MVVPGEFSVQGHRDLCDSKSVILFIENKENRRLNYAIQGSEPRIYGYVPDFAVAQSV